MRIVKRIASCGLGRLGLDVKLRRKTPQHTLAGLIGRDIRTILDVGANDGQSAKHFRTVFPNARIYCFEPLPDAFASLSNWAASQNGLVTAFNVALGDRTGEIAFNHHLDHSPSSSILESTDPSLVLFPETRAQTQIQVPINRMDEFKSFLRLENEVLLKMDVQGYESQVLKGGADILQRVSACIIELCVKPLYDNQSSFDEIVNVMYGSGFRYHGNVCQVTDPNGRIVYLDSVFLKEASVS
jgi:FkbM family methyltransferase